MFLLYVYIDINVVMVRPSAVSLGIFSHVTAKMGSDGNVAGDLTANEQSRDVTASEACFEGHERNVHVSKRKKNLQRNRKPYFTIFCTSCFFSICFCDSFFLAGAKRTWELEGKLDEKRYAASRHFFPSLRDRETLFRYGR